MGTAPPEMHVLDLTTFANTALVGVRETIAIDDTLTYTFDTIPDDARFAKLAGGALFGRFGSPRNRSWREPPVPETFPDFSLPKTSSNWTEWEYHVDATEKEERESRVLVVLLLPEGYSGTTFNIRHHGVKAVGQRLAFLFIKKPPDGLFKLSWRTIKMTRSIEEERQHAFEEAQQLPNDDFDISVFHRDEPARQDELAQHLSAPVGEKDPSKIPWPRSDILAAIGIAVTAVGSIAAVVVIPAFYDSIFWLDTAC